MVMLERMYSGRGSLGPPRDSQDGWWFGSEVGYYLPHGVDNNDCVPASRRLGVINLTMWRCIAALTGRSLAVDPLLTSHLVLTKSRWPGDVQ
jgi:hypothetical protein